MVQYTQASRVEFVKTVSQRLANEVAARASAGPWLLAADIRTAVRGAPAPDGSELHVCGLIEANDARAAVAGDPESLRLVAAAMSHAADDPSAPAFDVMVALALRYDEAMMLNQASQLQAEISAPPVPAAPEPTRTPTPTPAAPAHASPAPSAVPVRGAKMPAAPAADTPVATSPVIDLSDVPWSE